MTADPELVEAVETTDRRGGRWISNAEPIVFAPGELTKDVLLVSPEGALAARICLHSEDPRA